MLILLAPSEAAEALIELFRRLFEQRGNIRRQFHIHDAAFIGGQIGMRDNGKIGIGTGKSPAAHARQPALAAMAAAAVFVVAGACSTSSIAY